MIEFSISIRPFQIEDKEKVVTLWENCNLIVPWNNPYKDILRKMEEHPELFLVGIIDHDLNASVMGGYDGHRGWINYLAVNPKYQNHGFGKLMMENIESRLEKIGCPKINLQIRHGNEKVISFYEKLGYFDDRAVSLGKRLKKDQE